MSTWTIRWRLSIDREISETGSKGRDRDTRSDLAVALSPQSIKGRPD